MGQEPAAAGRILASGFAAGRFLIGWNPPSGEKPPLRRNPIGAFLFYKKEILHGGIFLELTLSQSKAFTQGHSWQKFGGRDTGLVHHPASWEEL